MKAQCVCSHILENISQLKLKKKNPAFYLVSFTIFEVPKTVRPNTVYTKQNIILKVHCVIFRMIYRQKCNIIYNPKSEKVGTVWKTQIKKESSDF